MTKMQISLDSDILQRLTAVLNDLSDGSSLPASMAGMEQAAGHVKKSWQGYAMGGGIPGVTPMKSPSSRYAGSIKIKKNGPFDYEIASDAEIADWIENGTSQVDMKQTHPYGDKGRVAKKKLKGGGYKFVPYVIIPFRWGTPKSGTFRNIMPEAVYQIVKGSDFTASVVKKETHLEDNFWGEGVSRREYKWGSSLDGDSTGDDFGDAEGMVKMAKRGGYFTFRVISADSPADSWIKPATPARHVTSGVVAHTQEAVSAMIEQGLKEDFGI
jgi:hypothetical protein